MRAFLRFIGMVFAAGAFVSFVIDGTKSIADGSVQVEPVRNVWAFLSAASYNAAKAAVDANFSAFFWERIIEPALMLPLFAVLLGLALLFLALGRRPRSRIGYVARG